MRSGARMLVLLILLVSCSSSPVPRGILPPAAMYAATKDMMQVDEYINNYLMADSTVDIKQKRSALYTQVFSLHHTDKQQFYKSYDHYRQHPDLLKTLFDSLSVSLKKQDYPKALPTHAPPSADSSVK